jgi:hypothetical protein
MTTYTYTPLDLYRKPPTTFEKLNPWINDPILKDIGKIPISTNGGKYYDFGILEAEPAPTRFVNEEFYEGQSTSKAGSFPVPVKWLTSKSFMNKVNFDLLKKGDPSTVARYGYEMETNINKLKRDIIDYSLGFDSTKYLNIPANKDYDIQWNPLFAKQAVVGSNAANPADANGFDDNTESGAIIDLTANNLAGTNKTQDFVKNTFGHIEKVAIDVEDTWGRKMIDLGDLMSRPKLTHYVNPKTYMDMQDLYPKSGVNENPRNYLEAVIAKGHKVVPTERFGLAYSNAEDGVIEVCSIPDIESNFKFGLEVPLNIEEGVPFDNPTTRKTFHSFLGTRFGLYRKPFKVGVTYHKAQFYWKFTYKNDA